MWRLAMALVLAAVCSAYLAQNSDAAASGVASKDPRLQALKGAPLIAAEGSRLVLTYPGPDGVAKAVAVVDRRSGRVIAFYTGDRAEFPLARGKGSGVAQRKLNSWWLWIPLSLLFVGAFFDRRRPWRLLHLDLAVVVLFGVSYAFFMRGDLDVSVPLTYPPLAYMLARMLVAGFRPRRADSPLSWLSLRWLVGLTLALAVGRIALLLADPFTLDVGYASTAGADRILNGLELYTRGGNHLDTYGPFAYLAYVPFVLLWPFRQAQENPPAAQAAAIFFDLATVAGLVVLGRQLRDSVMGWALALAWVACPFTALSLAAVSNDTLVAALLVWALVAIRSGPALGALVGLAAAAKFAPGLLVPALLRAPAGPGAPGRGPAPALPRAVVVALAALAVAAVTLVPLLPDGGLREFYDATVGFQLQRSSPFSIWTQHDSLDPLQTVLKAAALALAVAVAFIPRTRSLGQMAALGAAVLVAAQIPMQHWFYLYLVWVLPLYCIALFSEHAACATRRVADEPPAA